MSKKEKKINPINTPNQEYLACKTGLTDIIELGRIAGQPKVTEKPGSNGYEIIFKLHIGATVHPVGSEQIEEWRRFAWKKREFNTILSKVRSGMLVAFQGYRRTKIVQDTEGRIYYQNVNIITNMDILDEQISMADTMIREIQQYDRIAKRI